MYCVANGNGSLNTDSKEALIQHEVKTDGSKQGAVGLGARANAHLAGVCGNATSHHSLLVMTLQNSHRALLVLTL